MEEELYCFTSDNNYEDTDRDLKKFISRICERKRKDAYDDGCYKAVIAILPSKCYYKTCERDGASVHHHSLVNIIRYDNNDTNYLDERDISNPFSYVAESKQIREEVVEVGFSSGLNELIIEIFFPKNVNRFQYNSLKHIVDLCYLLKGTNIYPKITIAVRVNGTRQYDELKEESYNQITGYIEKKLSELPPVK